MIEIKDKFHKRYKRFGKRTFLIIMSNFAKRKTLAKYTIKFTKEIFIANNIKAINQSINHLFQFI